MYLIKIFSGFALYTLFVLGIQANVVFSQCSNSFCGNEIFLEMRNTLFSLYKTVVITYYTLFNGNLNF